MGGTAGARPRGRIPALLVLLGLVLAAVVLPARPAAAATTLYVAPTGCSDSGSGTVWVPFCSISAAAAVAVPGQTVRVSSGTYRETVEPPRSGLAGARIVYRAATGAKVVVTGGTYGFVLRDVGHIRISGFTITGTSENGIYLNGASNIELSANRVEKAGVRVEGLTAAGIYVKDTVDSTVSGNVVADNSGSGIYLTGGTTRVLVTGNESTANAFGWQRNANGIDVRAPGNSVIGNRTHHNEDSGIQVYPGGNHTLVANNLSYENRGFTTTQLANCSHPSSGNTAGCFTGDHGIDNLKVIGSRIIGNTVHGNTTAGINLEGLAAGVPSEAVIANNVSVDNAVDCPDGAGGVTTCPATKGNIRVDATSGTGTVVDRDVVWTSTPGGIVMAWGNISYRTLAEVRAVSGQETNGVQADPRFVAPGTGDFRLGGGSPAIDMADSGVLGQQAADLVGRARADDVSTANTGVGPRTYDDAGAYEYPPVPGTPTATATAGYRSVALTWTVPPAGGSALTRFTVYRGTSPGSLTRRATLSSTTTGWTDTQVTAWTRYYYEVTASNGDGESSRSAMATATPTGPPIAPSAPVATATTAPQQVSLAWQPPAANGSAINRYLVYRGTTPAPTTLLAQLPATATGFVDGGRTNGVTYYYRVRAGNGVGLSAYSADVAAMPTSITLVGTAAKPLTSGVTASTLPLPAGAAEGDLLIAWLGFTNAATSVTGLEGWTPLPGSPMLDGAIHAGAAYYKVASAAETEPALTWTTTSKGAFAVAAYRGVDPVQPVAVAQAAACDLRSTATVATPRLAPARPGSWAVAMFSSRSSAAAAKQISWEPGAGLQERVEVSNSAALSSPWVGVTIADSAGAVPMAEQSFTATASFPEAHHHGALLYLSSVAGAP